MWLKIVYWVTAYMMYQFVIFLLSFSVSEVYATTEVTSLFWINLLLIY